MITITPIAYVKSSRKEIKDDYWGSQESEIVLAENISSEALVGLDQFSHCEILFHFHQADPHKTVTGLRHPRNNDSYPKVGIYARRGKNRPNHIGLTTVKIINVQEKTLRVSGLDAIDGTPVIDIKPVMKGFLPCSEVIEPDWSHDIMKKYWGS